MKMTNRFALFEYSTENIGDEVQSIAARQFLPKVNLYIDRDQKVDVSSLGGETKLIMNGWFTHKPENWPPVSQGLKPLLTSIYIDSKNKKTTKAFFSDSSKKFLKEFGPVGARDLTTLELLKSHEIPAYFSGCVTLTLQRDERYKRQDFVLLVDVSKEVEERVRRVTRRPIITLSVYRTPQLSREEKYILAEYYLYLYQSAHAVLTTRLHTMLPCLAFETPVCLVKESKKYEPNRYRGLAELVNSVSEADLLSDSNAYNVENPKPNPTNYLALREGLSSRCSKFTGYKADTYLSRDIKEVFNNPLFANVIGAGAAATYRELLRIGDVAWQKELNQDLRKQHASTLDTIEALKLQLKSTEDALHQSQNTLHSTLEWKVLNAVRTMRKNSGG